MILQQLFSDIKTIFLRFPIATVVVTLLAVFFGFILGWLSAPQQNPEVDYAVPPARTPLTQRDPPAPASNPEEKKDQ